MTKQTTKTTKWQPTIGLEVHARLSSAAKLFSAAPTAFGAEPNSQVSPVDAAMPGMLPVINRHCVHQAVKTALGLEAKVHLRSVFDRKHYFYPDLPQGYQISQFHHPIASGGRLAIKDGGGGTRQINITRMHMEQDAGKSLHDVSPTSTAIDLNRSGTPLVEIVTEPELHSAEEAADFVRRLRTLLVTLNTCDGNMEEGSLRADVNVSIARDGEPLGTRAEIKNLNSARFIQQAVTYEIKRQIALREKGERVQQQTRLFNPKSGKTFAMRSKEEAHDYRYFPDPDLPPLVIEQSLVHRLRRELPTLPMAKQQQWREQHGLSDEQASALLVTPQVAAYFDEVAALAPPKLAAKWILGELFALLNKLKTPLPPMAAEEFAALLNMIGDGKLSERAAKDILPELGKGKKVAEVVAASGLTQISDEGELEQAVQKVLAENADKVAEYKQGREQLFGFFVGRVMRATDGRANPQAVNGLLKTALAGE